MWKWCFLFLECNSKDILRHVVQILLKHKISDILASLVKNMQLKA